MNQRPGARSISASLLRCVLSPLLVWTVASVPVAATTFYVDGHALPGGDGSSWASAFASVDDALAASAAHAGPDEIWVAQGRYLPAVPTSGDPREATFRIPHNTTLLGGFLGTEPGLPPLGSPRHTELSGDIGLVGTATDNAYHVVTAQSVNGTLTVSIDGFLIRGGNANGFDARGGGLFVNGGTMGLNLSLSRCIVRENSASSGGGMFYQSAHVRMTRCTFEHNTAAGKGGALRAQAAYMRCDGSRFRSNTSFDNGGAVFITGNPSPATVFVNCTFTHNTSVNGNGGAAAMNSGTYTAGAGMWVNCTFAENTCAQSGSAVFAAPPNTVSAIAILRNCVAWNNSPAASTLANAREVSYSDIEGGWAGAGNLSLDPLLTPVFALGDGSPAIDAGGNHLVLPDVLDLDRDGNTSEPVPLDLAGHRRRLDDVDTTDTGAGIGPIVDMGAFEHR